MTTDTPVIEKKKVISRIPKEPGKYKVIVYNDDVTPVEFVVAMLVAVFRHDQASALKLTLAIHNEGSAVAGTYSFEIAEQKTSDAKRMAINHGFPLVVRTEAE
jgi:ATP-dependent Clp protease adaptor protein ClpS